MKNDPQSHGNYTAPGEVRFVRLLPGPIERVWEYLTVSEKRAKWFAGGPMDLQVGGRVELTFRHSNIAPHETPPAKYQQAHEPGITMKSEVTRCEPPRLLSYTFFPEDGQGSEVTFELTSQGKQVQLVLTHRRLEDRNEMVSVGAGWHLHLDLLAALLRGEKLPPFWPSHGRLEAEYSRQLESHPKLVPAQA